MEVVAPNEWTQQIDDGMLHTQMAPGGMFVAATPTSATPTGAAAAASGPSTAGARAPMERPQAPPGQDGQALRCPRCDSSNTKFCYYNNYSLSQPRHFCKACKRYWTRGGTLRNVPVGGGCRKNKRVKKPHPNAATTTSSSSTEPSPPTPSLPFLSNPTTMVSASSDIGLLLYSLANPASVPSSTTTYETLSVPCNTPYDQLQPQLGALGLSFPSNPEANYFHGVKTHAHLAAAATAASPLQECSIFGSAAASLLASSLKQQQQQHKLVQNPNDPSPYGDLHPPVAGGNLPAFLKDVKLEGGDAEGIMSSSNHRNMLEWQFPSCENNPMEAIATESSSLYWNAAAAAFGGGVWPDAASCGPSVAPPI